ncbi:hemolymph lipopolysaccharide-binding protein-like [Periplaneta americana]|uniref:hemolymph lipopolysaccharide-binding protein-like n=1 Tax=Periplaneta americana TaxID=6978 RepID=UPI0037E79D7A
MLRCATVCCVLWCAVACAELQCALPHTSALKFSITSLRNETGHWIAQLQLGHTAEEKNRGPWELDVDHSTAKCEDSESILIAAKITAPPTAQISVPLLRGVPTAPGYELVPLLGYYKLHSSVNTWHGALKICEDEGAHLMVINSEAEVQALKPLWEKTPPAKITGGSHNDWAWVGFHDLYKEGEFVTIFNETLQSTGYVKWAGGEGKGGADQNCGLVHRNLLLADYPCNARDAFFCEREL